MTYNIICLILLSPFVQLIESAPDPLDELTINVNIGGMLPPPPYDQIPGVKKCLGTKSTGSVWCLPFEKPTACNPTSWEQVMTLQKDPKIQLPSCGKIWAVLVAGSEGWINYRHQADVCHAYQVLHEHGVDDANIVVIMKDDIAYHFLNPTQGKIINRPDGPNVYTGVPKDYTGDSVTPEVFLSVLQGDKAGVNGRGSGKVVESGPYDHIFVFYSDHGGIGVLEFPDGHLTVQDLNTTIMKMNNAKKYGRFLFYLESCFSGSMFKGILPDNIDVLAVTASDADESSWSCYFDEERRTLLGDVFSVKWMEDSSGRNLSEWTVDQQITIVRNQTTSSAVCTYGDASIGNLMVGQFQGMNGKIGLDDYHGNCNDAVSCEELPLKIIQQIGGDQMEEEMNQLMNKRRFVDNVLKNLVLKVLGDTNAVNEILFGHNEISNFNCHSKAVKKFHERCFNLGKNSYALIKVQVLVNLCEAQNEEDILNAMEEVCTHAPVVGIN